jgi:hypothetical protein
VGLITGPVAELMLANLADVTVADELCPAVVAGAGLFAEMVFDAGSPNGFAPFGCHPAEICQTGGFADAAVMERVVATARHEFEVFQSVVVPDFVAVVNNLAAGDWATDRLRHDEDVFSDIPPFVGVGVVGSADENVAVGGGVATTLVSGITNPRPRTLGVGHECLRFPSIIPVSDFIDVTILADAAAP